MTGTFWNLWHFLTHQIRSFRSKTGVTCILFPGRHRRINANHHFPSHKNRVPFQQLSHEVQPYNQNPLVGELPAFVWTQVPSVRRRSTPWTRTSRAAARKPTGNRIAAARGPLRSNGSGLCKRRAWRIPTCCLGWAWGDDRNWGKLLWYVSDMAMVWSKLYTAIRCLEYGYTIMQGFDGASEQQHAMGVLPLMSDKNLDFTGMFNRLWWGQLKEMHWQ